MFKSTAFSVYKRNFKGDVAMKCNDCDCCVKGYFKSKPNDYVCIGVKVPFVIKDIKKPCTEYPMLKEKTGRGKR